MNGLKYGTGGVFGNVQLNVVSGTGWSDVSIDLSLNDSQYMVLHLAPKDGDTVTLSGISGTAPDRSAPLATSYVLNSSGETTNLVLQVERNAAYFGNVGFGSYQNDAGVRVKTDGVINLFKKGNAAQRVGHAHLGTLSVGTAAETGGTFQAVASLIAHSLATYRAGRSWPLPCRWPLRLCPIRLPQAGRLPNRLVRRWCRCSSRLRPSCKTTP